MEELQRIQERQIEEVSHELKAFGITVSELTDAKVSSLVIKDAHGNANVGDMGLPEKSTNEDPTLLVEREASFCTLLFATDGQGTVITWHRPDIYESSDNLVDHVNKTFESSEEKILLVTGTHEERDQSRVREFFDEKFSDFHKIYMFAEKENAKQYPYSNLVYVPSELSSTGKPELLVGNVPNLTKKIRDEYHNLHWKYE